MKKGVLAILLGLVFLTYADPAHAKWWVFGRADNRPEIAHIFIGSVDIGTLEENELILDDSNLEYGNIIIKGFASKAEAPLAMAQVSIDDGVTWEKVNIKDGSFIYQFIPEEATEYRPKVKVMDTAGQESDLSDIPSFTLIYQAREISEVLEDLLQKMIAAYTSENLCAFTSYLSNAYVGDIVTLEEAIRSDFKTYNNIALDVNVQQANKSGNEAIVDFEFNWRAIKSSDGSLVNPAKGTTRYTFQQEGDNYKLLAMASPIIFGVSQASQVDTSSLNMGVDATSSIFSSQDTYASLPVNSATLNEGYGIDFSTGAVASGAGDIIFNVAGANRLAGDGTAEFNIVDAAGGALSSQILAPEDTCSGWRSTYSWAGLNYIFAVRENTGGKYAMFQITAGGNVESFITINYKYQTDGSRNLP